MAVLTSSISRFCFSFPSCLSPSPVLHTLPPTKYFNAYLCLFSGHAGAIVQARQLGDELYVGIHSDESILENKGPTVMTLQER
jgi:hypothetical protein